MVMIDYQLVIFFDKISYILCIGDLYGTKYYRRFTYFETA